MSLPHRRASLCAAALVALVLTGAVYTLGWSVGSDALPDGRIRIVEPLLAMLSFGIAGAVLIDRRPDLPFGWLLAVAATAVGVELFVTLPAYAAIANGDTGVLARWGLAASTLGFLPIAVQGLVNVRFPSGRPASRRGRALEASIVVGTALVVVGGFLGAGDYEDVAPAGSGVQHPLEGTAPGEAAVALVGFAPIVVLLGLVAGIGVVVRFTRAAGIERQQLKWRAAGVLVALALFPVAVTASLPPVLTGVDHVLFVVTLAVPVLRYRLWAIDTIIRRSAVYTLVTVVLVAGYVAVSVAATRVVSERVAAPLAAAVVALSFAPVRTAAQRLVDRGFYGDRADPYRLLSRLVRRFDAVPPGQALGAVVEAIAGSLRLPYVAIEHARGVTLASSGSPAAVVARWPLVYEGRVEGHLVAAPRRGEEGFDERDRQLLADVARQTGVAVHADSLTTDLLLSRQRLVTAREEERRRLRRELHDGLGPVLTATGLSLDAARARIAAAQLDDAQRHVAAAKEATMQAMNDLRELVHGLRPPALDELGFVGAVRAHAERLRSGGGMSVSVEAGELPALPAAVEVAAFRAAVEAITNAVRHGRASAVTVHVGAPTPHALVLEVRDDGRTGPAWTPGVGLTAMRERVEELGGSLSAGPAAAGGGMVLAMFPLRPASP